MRSLLPGIAVIAGILASGPAPAAEVPPRSRLCAVVLDDAAASTRDAARRGVEDLGGRVVHAFDDVLVAELPSGSEFLAYRLAGVREVALNAIPVGRRRGPVPRGLAAWNAIAGLADRDAGGQDAPPEDAAALSGDGLIPPVIERSAVVAASRLVGTASSGSADRIVAAPDATASLRAPLGATELNTSEYLAGSVSVNVVLAESDGLSDASTEDWSADREAAVVAKIAEGFEWARIQEPQSALSFVYHVVSGRQDARARTRYEPIRRSADPNGTTGEDLWVKEILGKLGYATGDRFARSRAFAADTRSTDGTDWAISVFVADSQNDVDGKFADGRFAYAWIGGPHLVMTYDNQSWGIDRMDRVVRHELMHAFYAFDEYQTSGCVCSEHRGYLDGTGSNCAACNASASSCVMINNTSAMCAGTRRQVGWADLDGDGAVDVVGEDPDTFLDALPEGVCGAPRLSGIATVVAPTNRNPATITPRASISINRVAGVEVRADGAAWLPADPDDALWGGAQERFSAVLPGLAPGPHRLEARAVDDRGNRDGSPPAADVLVLGPVVGPVGNSIRGERTIAGAVQFTWSPCAGAVGYRVLRAGAANGPWTAVGETTTPSWGDTAAGDGYVVIRTLDACGAESLE